MRNRQTILHPTNFSEQSKHAFDFAVSWAKAHGARLRVLHVTEPWNHWGGHVGYFYSLRRKEELLDKLSKDYADHASVCLVQEGDPVEAILAEANDPSCALIVMGGPARSRWKRLLRRSVATQVVRKATCPVVTVNQRLQDSGLFTRPWRGVEAAGRAMSEVHE